MGASLSGGGGVLRVRVGVVRRMGAELECCAAGRESAGTEVLKLAVD